MSPKLRAMIFLLCATTIWGFSYPIGKAGLEQLSPWAYAGLRFMFGTISLLPIALRRRRQPAPMAYSGNISPWLWLQGGCLCGVCLSIGGILQLYGMTQMPSSQVGFITTMYVSIVPILAFVTGYVPRLLLVIGLFLGLFGLYMLTGGVEGGTLGKSAAMVLAADVFWALQVVMTGRFAAKVNTWLFSLAQAMTSTILVLTMAYFTGNLPTLGVFFQTLPFHHVGYTFGGRGLYLPDPGPAGHVANFGGLDLSASGGHRGHGRRFPLGGIHERPDGAGGGHNNHRHSGGPVRP